MGDAEFRALDSRLKKAWLEQIRKAYDNFLWRHGLQTPPVSLALMRNTRLWGRWRPSRLPGGRCILLSEELIREHPWPAVLGILGHEALHQLTEDLTPAAILRGQPPHGPAFRSLGRSLGLDPFYLAASVDLRGPSPRPWPDDESAPLTEGGRRVLEKVRKLLALSSSPVTAEAQAALAAAARLMTRHNLDLPAEGAAAGAPECRLIPLGARRLDRRLALISHILGRHFFVRCIFVPGYDPATDTENHDLELLGRPENTRLAAHVCRFLLERGETLWREYRRRRPGGGLAARNSFILALLESFDRKLAEAAPPSGEAGAAAAGASDLVLARDEELEDLRRRRHPRLTQSRRGGRRRYCPESARAGRAAGETLNFNRPLENYPPPAPPNSPRLFLEKTP